MAGKNMAVSYKQMVTNDGVDAAEWADLYGLREFVETQQDNPRLERAFAHLVSWATASGSSIPEAVQRVYLSHFKSLQNGKPSA